MQVLQHIKRITWHCHFGLERLHYYTFGKPITVETDHQPLTSIWKKTIVTSSLSLQRLLLRLAQYNVHIEYLQGKENIIADTLSRVTPLRPEPQDYNMSLSNIEKDPSPSAHTNNISSPTEATRNLWGYSQWSNTDNTSTNSLWWMVQHNTGMW